MKKAFVCAAIGVLLLCGCSPSTVRQFDPADSVHTPKPFVDDPDDFQFAIVADPNGGPRPGVLEKAMGRVNLLQPEFVICVGDMIRGMKEEKPLVVPMWDGFDRIVGKLDAPFFFVVGNHDLTNPMMVQLYKERYGEPYYHFVYRGVLFLCLDTEDPSMGTMSAEQAKYVEKVLAEHQKVRWTMVFLHAPMWAQGKGKGWEPIEKALAGRKYTVFCGHTHTYLKIERNGHSYINLATTGGSSSLAGAPAGQFDEIAWVTMKDTGPVVANLMLEGILDENVRTDKPAGTQAPAQPVTQPAQK